MCFFRVSYFNLIYRLQRHFPLWFSVVNLSHNRSSTISSFRRSYLIYLRFCKNRVRTGLESQGKNGNLGLSQESQGKSGKVRELFSESGKIRFCWKGQGKIVIIYFLKKALCPCILIIFMLVLLCSLFHFSK